MTSARQSAISKAYKSHSNHRSSRLKLSYSRRRSRVGRLLVVRRESGPRKVGKGRESLLGAVFNHR
jgi:hypothetical protein